MSYSYQSSGVDSFKASEFVDKIARLRGKTEKKHRLFNPFGHFASAFDLSAWSQPVMVSSCDGIGTKLKLLLEQGALETAGKDLVAMSVNDVLTTGADPVLFLDYLATSKIDEVFLTRIIEGMILYLKECGCILAGGETAEMPGLVSSENLELAGFCIGVAEKEYMLDPTTIEEEDVIIGIPSDGFHANGYSLLRQILANHAEEFTQKDFDDLLIPTRLYFKEACSLKQSKIRPRAYAHITGGGLPENLRRILPQKGVKITLPKWSLPVAQKILSHTSEENALHTFNMGIGWVVILSPKDLAKALDVLPNAIVLGKITSSLKIDVTIESSS